MTIGIKRINTHSEYSRKPLIEYFEKNGTQNTLKLAQSLVEMERIKPAKEFLVYLETQISTFTKRAEWAESEQDEIRYKTLLHVYTKYKDLMCEGQEVKV